MEKYIFMFVGIVFGVAVSLYIYSIKKERDFKRIKNDQEFYSTQKLNEALEKAVNEMQKKMRLLNRKLTEEEKNCIIFDSLNDAEEEFNTNVRTQDMKEELK